MSQLLTIAELETRVGSQFLLHIADRDGDGALNAEETEIVNNAIRRATSEAYSMIGVQYNTPLPAGADTEALLGYVADLSVFHLVPIGDVVTDEIRSRRDNAFKWFKAVRDRMALLGGDTRAASDVRIQTEWNGDPREMNRCDVGSVM